MKVIIGVLLAFVIAATAFSGPITKTGIRSSRVITFVLTSTGTVSLSVTAGTVGEDIVFVEFSSQNVTTAVVGISEGTSPAATQPIKEDTIYYALPINGNAHVVCSTCANAAASVTVTVRTY